MCEEFQTCSINFEWCVCHYYFDYVLKGVGSFVEGLRLELISRTYGKECKNRWLGND